MLRILVKLSIRNKKLNPNFLCYDNVHTSLNSKTHYKLALNPCSCSIRNLAPLPMHMLQFFDNAVQFQRIYAWKEGEGGGSKVTLPRGCHIIQPLSICRSMNSCLRGDACQGKTPRRVHLLVENQKDVSRYFWNPCFHVQLIWINMKTKLTCSTLSKFYMTESCIYCVLSWGCHSFYIHFLEDKLKHVSLRFFYEFQRPLAF